MNLSPWLILRQAADAAATGRPDDAHRLIAPLLDEGYRKAWRLARDVAKAYCTRGAAALDRDNPGAAWADLLAAESLNTGEKCVAELRQTLTRFGLVQARGALEAGNPEAAAERAARLRDRGVRHRDLPPVEDAARDWLAAAAKADRGDFLPALDDLHRLAARLPCPPTGLDRFRDEVKARHERFLDAVGRAQDAATARRWRDAAVAAEEAVAAAPEYHAARSLRTKAWQAAYPNLAGYAAPHPALPADPLADTTPHHGPPVAATEDDRPTADPPEPHALARFAAGSAHVTASRSGRLSLRNDHLPSRPTPADSPRRSDRLAFPSGGSGGAGGDGFSGNSGAGLALPKRFILWVDGVAGFLVCTGPRVTFGQAVLEGGPVDVPLFADVSRIHAELTRDGEGFLVESGKAAPAKGREVPRTVLVNGKEVARSVLNPGDRVTLGATCQFVFHRPVTVSSTARLELTSGHRLTLPVEGVLLMANELILGPAAPAHVIVPGIGGKVLLYRSKDGLGVRYPGGKLLVNDRPHDDRAVLPLPAAVEADALTFAVEPVGPRL